MPKRKARALQREAREAAANMPAQIAEPEPPSKKMASMLSPELMESMSTGYGDSANGSNVLITDPDAKEPKVAKAPPSKKRLSNKQLKRLRKVIEQKEKRALRAQLLEDIAAQSIPQTQQALLHRSSSIASKMTVKQRLRQELKEERAGISVTADAAGPSAVRLTVPRKVGPKAAPVEEYDDDASTEDEDGSDAEMAATDAGDAEPTPLPPVKAVLLPRKHGGGPTAQELMRRPIVIRAANKHHVEVKRTPTIQENRLRLPILQEEHTIMESIQDNLVVIICGETGSGKTTQLPQFLYEAGYTRDSSTGPRGKDCLMIGVTEPRRIAATSMAKRVGEELVLSKREVSYQIRYQGTTSSATEIKFMTDGVLTKEIEQDFALRKYTTIIVDEAHERSVHTDILLGLLSRIVPLREKLSKEPAKEGKAKVPPLKLIIMSATLRVHDFTENARLFPTIKIPVISVDARQYPVGIHFSRRTTVDDDNVAAALRKVVQIHKRLPPGGILVFMTGQGDIRGLCAKLKEKFPIDAASEAVAKQKAAEQDAPDHEAEFDGELSDSDPEDDELTDKASKSKKALGKSSTPEEEDDEARHGPLRVLPLYSALSDKEQAKIFAAVPDGHRLCVVSTNVAETSLTIPGIRYVVDGGQVKSRRYDGITGVTAFEVEWISKAAANQRSGRAGRTGPGHCYRLYSSAVYQHDFPQFAVPEIKRMPVDGLMLQMKAMNIDKVVNFPFPTPPDQQALVSAEKLLILLGALDRTSKKITTLGRAMAKYPVSPRFSKMLCLARHYDCLQHVVAIVSALTVKELFARDAAVDLVEFEEDPEKLEQKKRHGAAMHQWKLEGISKGGDLGATLCAVGACDYQNVGMEQFCGERSLRLKAIVECNKLRAQLAQKEEDFMGHTEESVGVSGDAAPATAQKALAPPTASQMDAIRQIILSGFGDCVARVSPNVDKELAKYGIYGYNCPATDELVFIHPSSVLHRQKPEFVVYTDLVQGKTKLYMKGITIIEPEWLARLVPSACTFGKPLEAPAPLYDAKKDDIRCCMAGSFGQHVWPLPAIEMSYPDNDPDRYRYFARFLLEGAIFAKLAKFVPSLKNKPDILNKPWVKERVVAILQPLVDGQIDTKAKLLAKWKADPKFLMQAFSLWLPSDLHGELVTMWPPVE